MHVLRYVHKFIHYGIFIKYGHGQNNFTMIRIIQCVEIQHIKTPRTSSIFRDAYCYFMKRERLE